MKEHKEPIYLINKLQIFSKAISSEFAILDFTEMLKKKV